MFDYDWFHGSPYAQQREESRQRCVDAHFPDADPDVDGAVMQRFSDELIVRTLIYLRDGFSYEIKQFADVASKSQLVFECEPLDEHYKVGAFVVSVPFEEIVRVEVFAVHPSEKPDEMPQITGFRNQPEAYDAKKDDARAPVR